MLALISPEPYGDLSRIGQVSDRQFGWLREQPRVASRLLRAAPIAQADILVIGDSFSRTHYWQSVLTDADYRVATVFWDQIDESLCADFAQWLAHAGFRGELVLIESVERMVDLRLRKTAACTKMMPFVATSQQIKAPAQLERPPPFALNWNATLATGWFSLVRTQRAIHFRHDTDIGPKVRAREVANGCAMFSNRLCNKPLFFRDDDLSPELGRAHAEQMRIFTRAHGSVPMIWMIVPDKTTAYIDPGHGARFVSTLADAGLGPDLFAWAQEHKAKVRDFYFPNDTHLSMHGQLLLGRVMLNVVRKVVPKPNPPSDRADGARTRGVGGVE